jgi:hypothetical protein
MKRRNFLAGGLTGLSIFPAASIATEAVQSSAPAGLSPPAIPPDGGPAPEWLQYARAVYFDGYSPPVYPNIDHFDADQLVRIVLELGGNALRYQPIGYYAYYPSKTFPLFEGLGARDLLEEVVRSTRRAGIRNFCYVGYGAPIMLTAPNLEKQPRYNDWLLRGPDGRPYGKYGHNGWMTPLARLCATGDVYREAIRKVVRELAEYDIDGLYFDAPSPFGYSGICFCSDCRRNFKKFSGIDIGRLASLGKGPGLPFEWEAIPEGVDTEAFVAWYAWANELTRQDMLEFREVLHQRDKVMLCHDGAWVGTSLPYVYRIPDGFMVESSKECYDRLMTGLMGASMTRPHEKVAQMYLGSYNVSWFGEPPHEHPDVVHNANLEDSDEIRMEGFTGLACGNTPLYATANRLYFNVGSGSADAARDVFEVMKRAEAIHKGSVPVPYVTIVPTWGSQQLWRTSSKSWNWPVMSQGMGLAMLDARINFDICPSTEISAEWLASQKVIALCGASGISKPQAETLARWVDNGGGLLATYDTGLYDERGTLWRDGGPLQHVLGVRIKSQPLRSQPECYYRILENHPALGSYAKGAIVQGDTSLLPIEVLPGARILAECWNLGTDEVRGPAIVANAYGKGRVIYVNGSLEAHYLYDRVKSSRRLLQSMVEHLSGGSPQPFRLKAPRGVYGVLRRSLQGDPVLWLLANVGFKDASAGRMRQDYVPVSNVEIGIRIPEGRQCKEMNLVRANTAIPFQVQEEYATATLPTLHIAEVLHLALT